MINKEITLAGQKIGYTIKKHRRAKNLRLAISGNGCLVASKPWYVSQKAIEEFILEKARWVVENLERFKNANRHNEFRNSRAGYLAYRNQAERLILKKINEVNNIYQFKFSNISIRNQKTRWGSCSGRGNLNFNYKMIFLPEKIINYIVAHELCHLKEANHSARFWSLVAKTIPDYKIIRKDLKNKN